MLVLAAMLAGAAPPAAPRIVALMPSFAEDLCAIGAASQIVGVSQGTGDLACVRGRPRVAGATAVDAERILALRPDTIVAIPAQRPQLQALAQAGAHIVYLSDDRYADIFADIRAIGALAGRPRAAAALAARLRRETRRIAVRAPKRRPSVFVVVQAFPIWTAGSQTYVGALIRLAGGRDAAGMLRTPYGEYSPEALLRAQPDALVVGPDFVSEEGQEPWRSLRAVRAGRVYRLSDPSLLYRPGPRFVQGLAWLKDRLLPLER